MKIQGKAPTLLSPRLAVYFDDYSANHKTQGNKITHVIGIPLIVISLLGLLSQWVIAGGMTGSEYLRFDGGTLLLVLGLFWYLYLDAKIAVPFVLAMTGLYFMGRSLPVPVNWGLFILGWILQGTGHVVFEKKSPAFSKNLLHLLIGPLWIFARIVGYK